MSSDFQSLEQSPENFLKNIQIASPCKMNWNDMARTSEEAKRFCGDCRKHVFSIDQLSAKEAHQLIQSASANNSSVCVRLFKRADGTIITDDCPVGLRRIRNAWRRLRTSVASILLLLGALPALADDKSDCKSKAPMLLGRVVPAKRQITNSLPVLGEPTMVDYRGEAFKIPEIKAIADQINKLETSKNVTPQNRVEIVNLRLKMAREGTSRNLNMFASQELTTDLSLAKSLPDAPAVEKDVKDSLIKKALREKIALLKALNVTDAGGLQQQLDAMQN